MNTLKKTLIHSISFMMLGGLISAPVLAAKKMPPSSTTTVAEGQIDPKESKFPIGCTPVGHEKKLRILTLFPGSDQMPQSMYFFYNKMPQTISLYQMQGEESEYSTRFNHSIRGNSWAVLAVGEPKVKFICTEGDGKKDYGKIVDCAEAVNVCEYVHVKFGLNNKGNYWIVDSNTRNGAVSDVVHYGIIPGV